MAAMTAIFAPLSGRLVGARGPRLPLVVAGVAITVAAIMLTRLTATHVDRLADRRYVLFGIGFGMVNAPITNTAVSGMPRTQAGVAAAVASTSRQVGAYARRRGGRVGGDLGAAPGRSGPASRSASHVGWWIIAGCGAAVLVAGPAHHRAGGPADRETGSPTELGSTSPPMMLAEDRRRRRSD